MRPAAGEAARTRSHADQRAAAQGPDGWNDLQPCDDSDHWIWVDGYPSEAFEAAGLEPECGGTYFDPQLPTYVSAADSSVTEAQLDELRSQLEADYESDTTHALSL